MSKLRQIRGSEHDFSTWSNGDQSDYWALTSALARVFWELHIFQPAFTDPGFYLQQSYGSVWDTLVSARPGWDDGVLMQELLPRLLAVPDVLENGVQNLQDGNPTQASASRSLASLSLTQNGSGGAQPCVLCHINFC